MNFSFSVRGAVIVGAALALFLPSLFFTEFVYDDIIHIKENPLLRSSDGLWSLLSEPVFPGNLYRPLTFSSFWFVAQFDGVYPFSFHTLSLLLHAVNSYLLFLLLSKLRLPSIAFGASLLFALHPVHTEVVVNIVGQGELFAFFFGMLGILSVLHKRFLFAFVLFMGSALSKESGILFPLLGIATLYYANAPERSLRITSAIQIGVLVVVLALRYLALGSVLGGGAIDFIDNPIAELSIVDRSLNALMLVGKYCSLTVLPFPLSPDYSYAAIVPQIPTVQTVIFALLVLLALLLGISLFLFKRSVIGFGATWFFVSLLVTSNLIFPIGTAFADRLLYTPSVAGCLLLAAGVNRFSLLPIRALILFFLSLLSALWVYQYQFAWKSQEALLDWQAVSAPYSLKVMVNRAVYERDEGEYDEARRLLEQVISWHSRYADAYYTMGTVDVVVGRSEQADAMFRKALSLNPHHTPSLVALGRKLINDGALGEAEDLIGQVLLIEPHNIRAKISLYGLSLAKADLPTARKIEKELLAYNVRDKEFLTLRSKLIEAVQKGTKEKR